MQSSRRTLLLAGTLFGILGGAGLLLPPERIPQPESASELRLVVNLAGRRMDVFENGKLTRTFPVTIGADNPEYRTPVGDYRIGKAIWNPWWHPPSSSWARGRKPEAPGPNNPMGRVKLHFSDLLYVHGTTAEGDLGWAASHGCIRMANEDVIALARLVHRYGTPKLSTGVLDGLVKNPRKTQTIALAKPVALEIRYDIAEVREGLLQVHPDVYGKAGKVREAVLSAIAEAGYSTESVRRDMLDKVVEASRRSGTSLPVGAMLGEAAVAVGG